MARFISRSNPSGSRGGGPGYVMAATEQKQRPKDTGGDDADAGRGGGSKKIAKKGEDLKEEMDDLLDEIDAVLEENAEEFVKNYVQRGGE
jgi:ubiquitin-like protein Pup